MKILCIGLATYDITFPVDTYPIENMKYRMSSKIECGGGPASNAAYLLAKWKMNSYFAGVIGNDNYGNKILKEFNDIGVNTNFLEINKNIETTSSIIITGLDTGSRTVLTYRPNDIKMSDYDLDIKPDIILVDGQEFEASKQAILDNPNSISIIDAGSARDSVIELAKLVNYVVCSKAFTESLTGIKINYNDSKTLVDAYLKLKSMFDGKIIITLEEYGCIYEEDGNLKRVPSIPVEVIDSTGAGDVFHGAFVYGIANKFDIEKTLKYANIAGALSVTRMSGRDSMPSLEEVEDRYATLK